MRWILDRLLLQRTLEVRAASAVDRDGYCAIGVEGIAQVTKWERL